jgi:hypothetical protein
LHLFDDAGVSFPSEYNTWKSATFGCSVCHKNLRAENTKESRLESWQSSFICRTTKTCSGCKAFGHKREIYRDSGVISRKRLTEFLRNTVDLCCDQCQTLEKGQWDCEPHAEAGLMVDPIFGLPLFLKRSIKSYVFWAYNLEHLSHLRAYIEATERRIIFDVNSSAKSSRPFKSEKKELLSFSQVLPAWIKEAKHREILIKNIDSMIEELNKKIR